LLASATGKANIARARELIAVPPPVIDPPAPRHTIACRAPVATAA
jgi:hypothetical protein